jgi:hypothetical protein
MRNTKADLCFRSYVDYARWRDSQIQGRELDRELPTETHADLRLGATIYFWNVRCGPVSVRILPLEQDAGNPTRRRDPA